MENAGIALRKLEYLAGVVKYYTHDDNKGYIIREAVEIVREIERKIEGLVDIACDGRDINAKDIPGFIFGFLFLLK